MIEPELPEDASFDFDVRYLENGKKSIFLYLPKGLHAAIGLVIAHWGCFESLFDVYLNAMHAAAISRGKWPLDKHIQGSFSRRRKTMAELCEGVLREKKPEIADRMSALLKRSAELSNKRNLIAHGHYTYSILGHSCTASNCHAFNTDGQKFYFDTDVLKRLHHDISHLTADLVTTLAPIMHCEGRPPFQIVDDSSLIELYEKSKRTSKQS